MPVDDLLIEDGSGGVEVQDASGDLDLETPGSLTPSGSDLLLEDGTGGVELEDGSGDLEIEESSSRVLTLREAVRAWLAGQGSVTTIVGSGIYFAVPSQLGAYPCIVVRITNRTWGHNLDGADGTSIATVQIVPFGLYESDCIALAEAVRNFADGFQGLQSGVAIMTCFYDDESDPMPVAPPDGSDNFIYQCSIDYRVKHRVPRPTSVTQTYA